MQFSQLGLIKSLHKHIIKFAVHVYFIGKSIFSENIYLEILGFSDGLLAALLQ